jgi:phage recombination protein Bet
MIAEADFSKQAETTSLDALIKRALDRSGMTYATFVRSVTQNAFGSLTVWSEADLERLLLACEALGLSPVGRDMYAVRQEGQGSEVVLAVGLDGWARIVNRHPEFDGMEFTESPELLDGVPAWIGCTIHRRDRRFALTVKEYLCECKRDSGAWQTHPRRMLRHKALVQCARLAFELPTPLGVYDPDEAERVSLARPSRLERAGSSMPRGSVTAAQTTTALDPSSNTPQCIREAVLCSRTVGNAKCSGNSRAAEIVETLLARKPKPSAGGAKVANQFTDLNGA